MHTDELIPRDMCDTDLYQFSQGQMVFNQFPQAVARYKYTNRAKDKRYSPGFSSRLQEQIKGMADLHFTEKMYQYLKKTSPWLKETYLQWLRSYRFNPSQVNVEQNSEGQLDISIEGPWFETIYWEVPILYIVTQLSRTSNTGSLSQFIPNWRDLIREKAYRLYDAGLNWIDFGTRRRAAYPVQEAVCEIMKQYTVSEDNPTKGFRGTSNPYLAMKYGLTAFGTYSHQLPMAMQALYGIEMSNSMTMEHWVKEYRGDLGIALPDTLSTPVFLRSFDTFYAKLFDGIRQDSGDPKTVGDLVINHYKSLKINPQEKILVPSDSLTVDKAIDLHEYFKGRIKTTFGIGTHFTNDVGWLPSNHVIKLTEINFGQGFKPLVKISDDIGKNMGDNQLVADVKRSLGVM